MVSLHGVLVVTVTCLALVTSQSLSRQTCDAAKSEVSIQPGADAIIGGVLAMHEEGTNGFGCGTITSGEMPLMFDEHDEDSGKDSF